MSSVPGSLPDDTLKSPPPDDSTAKERQAHRQKLYRQAHRTEVAAGKRAWQQANLEKYVTYTRTYRAKHPEKVRAQRRATALAYRETRNAKKLAARAAYRAAHPESVHTRRQAAMSPEQRREAQAARSRAYYAAHREAEIARTRAYAETHPRPSRRPPRPVKRLLTEAERMRYREQRRAYYAANRERMKAYGQRYQATHVKKSRAYRAEFYAANRERVLAQQKVSRAAHPEWNRTASKRRRALERNAPVNDLTHAQWVEIQAAYAHRCVYCHKRRKGKLTQDHITPLSKGGSHTAPNVVPACQRCNSKKMTGPPPVPVQPLLCTIAAAKPHGTRHRAGGRP